MAVAGLHNISAFGPSFFDESQVTRPRTRASSILQMWRELESDHVVTQSHRSRSENDSSSHSDGISSPASEAGTSDDDNIGDNVGRCVSENNSVISETENQDNNSITSDLSIELGDNERKRVRHIFQEWMNCGATSHSSNRISLNNCSGSQTEIGRQRRPFRRICGRQTLLDLLVRAQCERKKELEGLLGQKPVSEFLHRNRIQALLRGRFLRHGRSLPDKRTSSVAATELGLLRERHTVSGLREGFISKLDNSASASMNIANETTDEDRREVIIETRTTFDSETAADEHSSRQELASQVTGIENPFSEHEFNVEEEMYLETDRSQQEVSRDELVLDREETEQVDLSNSTIITNEMLSENEDINYETESGGNNSEHFNWPDAISSRSWQERPTANNQWFQNASDDDGVGQDRMRESREDQDLQEAIDSWLDMPSGEVGGASVGRAPAFYFPDDDDNAQRMEIRELFSRRRVSGLLRSGFRESLNQVLQSHIERQGDNASGDWESEEASFSPNLLLQGMGQHNDDDDRAISHAEAGDGYVFAPTVSTLITESQPLWGFELQDEDLLHNHSSQHPGMEWDVVNELRTDMARLQQRLNNMQSMLEQCMDMQIELQRSVRQEVSAALNRSIFTRDESKGNTHEDGSKLDFVRKGICCVCRVSNIDSLLYRCGHMCTCSKCAEILVQGPGKCPMCQAPVVESIRAYFIH